jgi:hypothetical protein
VHQHGMDGGLYHESGVSMTGDATSGSAQPSGRARTGELRSSGTCAAAELMPGAAYRANQPAARPRTSELSVSVRVGLSIARV